MSPEAANAAADAAAATGAGVASAGAQTQDGAAASPAVEEVALTRSVGVQTMYRESQTQTDPFSADYITAPGQPDPEVLSIAHLTWGNGLPAGLEEIKLIQQMREKRAFEASLPAPVDEASRALRKKLLDERERQEWEEREKLMQEEQEARLQVLIEALKAREEKSQMLNESRINAVREAAVQKRDAAFDSIHRERLKTLRGLDRSREPSKKGAKRDIISETADFASPVYAPAVREGRMPVKNQVVDYGIPLLNNSRQLAALERTIQNPALRAEQETVVVPKPSEVLKETRESVKAADALERVHKMLTADAGQTAKPTTVNVYKRFEPVLRPPTPSVEAVEHEELSRAVLLLQRVLRGRAVQNAMHVGRTKALPLIEELRLGEGDAEIAIEAQEAQYLEQKTNRLMSNALDLVQGQLISEAASFLSKEVARLAEAQEITKFVEAAREDRRLREAEESGRRQMEHAMRLKKEHVLELVLETHRATADRYLDDVFESAVESAANARAQLVAEVKQTTLDPIVTALEGQQEAEAEAQLASQYAQTRPASSTASSALDAVNANRVVQDLLSTYVLPEVARQRAKETAEIANRRHLVAVHAAAAVLAYDVLAEQTSGLPRITQPVDLPEHVQASPSERSPSQGGSDATNAR